MLIEITQYSDLDEEKLMAVYAESNYENTDYFFPLEQDKTRAVKQVETGFLTFLKQEFFKLDQATVWVMEEYGDWISAMRTCRIEDDVYFLEALETHPEYRRQGYAAKLLSGVTDTLKQIGSFRLCACVSKKNIASLKTHRKCGFQIVSDVGFDYLLQEGDDRDYGLAFIYREN